MRGAHLAKPSTNSPGSLRRLDAVLVSVDYADFLKYTLPYNIGHFDRYVIVTTPYDVETQCLATQYGAQLVISDRCHEDGDAFNKGKLLNDGLAVLDDPDWVLFTDADILLPPRLRSVVAGVAHRREVMFGARRRLLSTIDEATIHRLLTRPGDVSLSEVEDPRHIEPLGYFQLWNARAAAVRDRWPQVLSEEFATAAAIDSWFHIHWPRNELRWLGDDAGLDVYHIPHGPQGQNWNGRRRLQLGGWRFAGFITRHGIVVSDPWPEGARLKLVGVNLDSSVEITPATMQERLQFDERGVVWAGRALGEAFITLFWRPAAHPVAADFLVH